MADIVHAPHDEMVGSQQPLVTEVRRAGPDDVARLSLTLARAFADDPLQLWLVPRSRRSARATAMFGFLLAMQVSRGETYTTSDGVGAAVWAPPGRWQLDPGTMAGVRERFIAIFGGNLARAVETYGVLDASHPAEPHHWYLATLGTHPDWQGQGIGTALIQPVLERADAEGVPAYLESSKESNLAYYARFGFDVIGKIDVPDGGPTLWPMWREPRSH